MFQEYGCGLGNQAQLSTVCAACLGISRFLFSAHITVLLHHFAWGQVAVTSLLNLAGLTKNSHRYWSVLQLPGLYRVCLASESLKKTSESLSGFWVFFLLLLGYVEEQKKRVLHQKGFVKLF